jgi:hypothetical protein
MKQIHNNPVVIMSNNNSNWRELTDSRSKRLYYYNKVFGMLEPELFLISKCFN